MKRKATENNPYNRHHSPNGGRKYGMKVFDNPNSTDVEKSEPTEERYEIDLSIPFLILAGLLSILVYKTFFIQ